MLARRVERENIENKEAQNDTQRARKHLVVNRFTKSKKKAIRQFKDIRQDWLLKTSYKRNACMDFFDVLMSINWFIFDLFLVLLL